LAAGDGRPPRRNAAATAAARLPFRHRAAAVPPAPPRRAPGDGDWAVAHRPVVPAAVATSRGRGPAVRGPGVSATLAAHPELEGPAPAGRQDRAGHEPDPAGPGARHVRRRGA